MPIEQNEPLEHRVKHLEQTITSGRTSIDNMANDFEGVRRDMARMKASLEASQRWARRYKVFITLLLVLAIIALAVDIYQSVYGF